MKYINIDYTLEPAYTHTVENDGWYAGKIVKIDDKTYRKLNRLQKLSEHYQQLMRDYLDAND